MANKRSVKVYGQSGYKYRETPTIMLKGLWLKEAGFDIGDYISVTCEDGKIIISTMVTDSQKALQFAYICPEQSTAAADKYMSDKPDPIK